MVTEVSILETSSQEESFHSGSRQPAPCLHNGNMAPKATIPNYVKAWRERASMTQDALAAAIGSGKAKVSKLERGEQRLTTEWMAAIAAALRINPEDLLRDPDGANGIGNATVPIVSWVQAGHMTERDGITDLSDAPCIMTGPLPQGQWIALRVDGDSMDRISPPESIILVNRAERRLVPNACYVIADEEGAATYKRYRPSPDRFEPVSVNPTHEPMFPTGPVHVIGRVRRTILEM